ncbi:MAG: HD domain-containing protein [Candidatus Paceibacterota bacterium]
MDLKSEDLIFNNGTEHIWVALDQIPRTGWVQWEIPNPETVAEHIMAAKRLALEYKNDLELDEQEFFDLLAMIEIHDWPEMITGDVVIMGDESDFIERKKKKRETELIAMEEICQTIPDGEKILSLYKRYVDGYDRPAILTHDIEKIQAVLLAADYEKSYGKEGLLIEFLKYTKPFINTEFAINKLDEIAKINRVVINRL